MAAIAVALGMLGTSVLGGGAAASATLVRIHLSARPPIAKVAERTRFVFVATQGSGAHRRPVRGALVVFAGSRARTDRRGRAVIVHRFATSGSHRARACKKGLACGRATVRAVPYVAG